MFRTFSAVAWMQVRSLWNGFVRIGQRDLISTLLTSVAVVVMIGSSLGFAVVVLALSYIAGRRGDPTQVSVWVLGITFLFTVVQGASGERGLSLDLRRFLVLPMSRLQLALLELIGSALAPAQWVFFPILAALALGLSAGAGFRTGLVVAALAVVVLLTAVLLQRIVMNATTLAGRRAREILIVTLAGMWVGATFLFVDESLAAQRVAVVQLMRGTPAELSARIISAVAAGTGPEWIAWAGVLGWFLLCFGVHVLLTRALIARGGAPTIYGRVRTRSRPLLTAISHLLPRGLLGVLGAEARILSRMPFVWLLLLIPGMLGLFLGGMSEDTVLTEDMAQLDQWIMLGFLVAGPSLLSNTLILNYFGTDAEGVGHFIRFPVRHEWVFAGKALARFTFVVLQLFIFSVGFVVRGMGEPPVLAAGLAGGVTVAVWLFACGNLTSVRLAYRMSSGPRRDGTSSAAIRSMFGQFSAALVASPAAAVTIVGYILGGPVASIAGSAAMLVLGLVAFSFTSRLGGRWIQQYGPDLLQELSREP